MLSKRFLLILIISFSGLGFIFLIASSNSQSGGHYLKKYFFTEDWFTHNISVWKKVLRDFKRKTNVHYLEIGVFEGRSFIWMLENILTHPTSTATGIDPLPKEIEKILYSNLTMSGAQEKTKIIKGYSQIELKRLPNHSFDIIYIDGDHKAANVLVDTVLSWPLLKTGGLLIFDDYAWKIEEYPPTRRPRIAVDAFLAAYKEYVDVIHLGYQCIIRKKAYFYWEENKNI